MHGESGARLLLDGESVGAEESDCGRHCWKGAEKSQQAEAAKKHAVHDDNDVAGWSQTD